MRQVRKDLREGAINEAQYEEQVNRYMEYAIGIQDKLGLDVLVHGEPERSDMFALPCTAACPPRLLALL